MHYSRDMTPLAHDDPNSLACQLRASRGRLAQITGDFEGERLLGPKLAIVNPPLWELGHVAYFQEYWCLRYRGAGDLLPSLLPNADKLYDSAKVAHDTRWDLPLPDITATRKYQADVLQRVMHRLEREPENEALKYFVQLAALHEDMHAEAFHYTRQTLAYTNPYPDAPAENGSGPATNGDIEIAGGVFLLGAHAADGFVFDNEKWAHEVRIAPYRIARVLVTYADYLDFVEADGYLRREFWDDESWSWQATAQLRAPRYWIRCDDTWMLRRFDATVPLPLRHPVMHVNWHEARAYCRYARRRLPTEAEWEYAAAWDASNLNKQRYPWGDNFPEAAYANLESSGTVMVDSHMRGDSASGCRQMLGNVWEWTESAFGPYPGFVADPYKEYSQPWFGTHKVLRGGSFATSRRLIRNTWRNFFTPDRGDVFAGFRTCALA